MVVLWDGGDGTGAKGWGGSVGYGTLRGDRNLGFIDDSAWIARGIFRSSRVRVLVH